MAQEENKADYEDRFDVTFLSRDGIDAQDVVKGRNRARRALYRHMNKNYHSCKGFIGNNRGMEGDFFTYLTPDNIVINTKTQYWYDGEVVTLEVGLTSFVTDVEPLSKELQELCLDEVFKKGYKLRNEN